MGIRHSTVVDRRWTRGVVDGPSAHDGRGWDLGTRPPWMVEVGHATVVYDLMHGYIPVVGES